MARFFMHKRLYRVGQLIFFAAWINLAVFWVVGLSIGGDALSGRVVDGRYYVSNHGTLTEVSAGVWNYSKVHTISVWILHPIGILVGGGLMACARRK